MPHEEDSVQGSLEQSAKISSVVFNAPPTLLTYGYVLVAAALLGLTFEVNPRGVLTGLLVLAVPALLAGPLSAPLANALGGTLYYKRAAFISAVAMSLVGVALLVGIPLRLFWHVPLAHVLLVGYMMGTSFRHTALWITSDNRHTRTMLVSGLQVLAAVPFMDALVPGFGQRELWILLALAALFYAPLIFVLHIFDTPLKSNFKVSGSELFRYYLDHLTSGRMDGEEILNRFAEPIRARFGLIAFRRRDGSTKAAIVVPALHPGPIGRLGGSDLPAKVAEAMPGVDLVMVPHGAATHDYNPVSSKEVERFGRAAAELLKEIRYVEGGSAAHTAGHDIRVTSQVFGDTSLLTYTSWPLPIDDVDYGVGLAAELQAELEGIERAFFVDCHNSLLPGAGQVNMCTPRADSIVEAAREASRAAKARPTGTLRVGIAQDNATFGRDQLIGTQGVQALVTEAGGQRFAYVLWDGNNAVPEVTRAVGEALQGLVDGFQVMTTDNHSVNAVAGSYGPVGHLAPPKEIAAATRRVVERALADLEPVTCGGRKGVLEDFRVFGNQKTVQLTASINTMASITLELTGATIAIQAMGTALLFLTLRAVGA